MITVIKNNDEIRMALDDDANALDNIPEFINRFSSLFMYSIVVIVINVVRNNGRLTIRWSDADHDLKVFNPLQSYPADEKATRMVQLLQYLINTITVVSQVPESG
jgi:hypothetical protein